MGASEHKQRDAGYSLNMTDKPQIGWVTAKDAAKGVGINGRNFLKWDLVAVGKIGRTNYYLLSDVIGVREKQAYEKGQRDARSEDAESPAEGSEKDNRNRLVAAQADAQEMKNEVARHETAPFAFMTFVMSKAANVIAGVMDGMPVECMRQLNLTVPEVEKVKAIVSVSADSIANLGNDEWMEMTLDEFIEETG